MGARSSGSAVISFSLITVPVKLYLTAASEAFSFNMITPGGSRVKQKLVDAADETKEIDRKDCLKGYEYEKDKYITLTDEELKALEGDRSNTIDVAEFVEDVNFNPIAVEKCYYLAPDKGAERTYRLLSRALTDMKKIAVGKYYARGRDHLVALRANGDALTLFQMYYANEIRPFEYSFSSALSPTDKELELAKMLIGKFTCDKFDVTKFNDQYAERIREMIERKRSGEIIEAPKQVASAPAMDLMKLLEASLAGGAAPAAPAPVAAPVAPQIAIQETTVAATTAMDLGKLSEQEAPTKASKSRKRK